MWFKISHYFIYPVYVGVSLGVIVAGIHHISDAVFLSSAEALANMVTEDDLKVGRMYPPLTHLRYVCIIVSTFLKVCLSKNVLGPRTLA